jgi:hypothetical protein
MPFYLTDTLTGQLYRVDVTDGLLVQTPISDLPDNLVSPSGARGYSPDEIIEMANKRTDRRGAKILDLAQELLIASIELCQERRWHWRKRSIKFPTVAQTAVYDLSAQNGMGGLTCERVCKEGPRVYRSGSTTDYAGLTAIFETDIQDGARDSTETGFPGQYFFDGQDQFRLFKTPDNIYNVRVPMWVLPDLTPLDTGIRLVPAYLHHLLLKALEARIFRWTLGEGSIKYQAAVGEYNAGLLRASLNTEFAEGRVREWRDTSDSAIQSS